MKRKIEEDEFVYSEEKKPVIKNNKPKKLCFNKKVIKGVAYLCAFGILMVGAIYLGKVIGDAVSDKIIEKKHEQEITDLRRVYYSAKNLPSQEKVDSRIAEIFASEEEQFLLTPSDNSAKYCRYPVPRRGCSIEVAFYDEISPARQELINFALTEFNDVFAVINDNYKFVANFSPDKNSINPYEIPVTEVDSFDRKSALGLTTTKILDALDEIDDSEIYYPKINLLKNMSDTLYFQSFKHELLHTLGLGDAYLKKSATLNTIMQGAYSTTGFDSFYQIDVAILDAFYRDPNNIHSDEYIDDFVKNYGKQNYLISKNYSYWGYVVKKIDKFLEAPLSIDKFNLNNAKEDKINGVKELLSQEQYATKIKSPLSLQCAKPTNKSKRRYIYYKPEFNENQTLVMTETHIYKYQKPNPTKQPREVMFGQKFAFLLEYLGSDSNGNPIPRPILMINMNGNYIICRATIKNIEDIYTNALNFYNDDNTGVAYKTDLTKEQLSEKLDNGTLNLKLQTQKDISQPIKYVEKTK